MLAHTSRFLSSSSDRAWDDSGIKGERVQNAMLNESIDIARLWLVVQAYCSVRFRGSWRLPSLFPCESLVEQGQHLWYVELDVFEIQIILSILLHFKQIVQLQI